jgi:hypothetical protein
MPTPVNGRGQLFDATNLTIDETGNNFVILDGTECITILSETDMDEPVIIRLYDSGGRLVADLALHIQAGQPVYIPKSGLAPGMYLLGITTDSSRQVLKIMRH